MPRVLGITFDAFGTLVDTGRDVLLRVAARAASDHVLAVTADALLARWDAYFFSVDPEPFLTLEEATGTSLAKALRDLGVEADPGPYVDLLREEWMAARPYPEVPDVLRDLEGVPRAVVSNADDGLLKSILRRNGLEFDAVITSEAVRAYKPAPRIFESAIRELGLPASGILHVGDSLDADVLGAQRLGMRTAWVNRAGERPGPGAPRPDAVLEDLRGVPRVLGSLP